MLLYLAAAPPPPPAPRQATTAQATAPTATAPKPSTTATTTTRKHKRRRVTPVAAATPPRGGAFPAWVIAGFGLAALLLGSGVTGMIATGGRRSPRAAVSRPYRDRGTG